MLHDDKLDLLFQSNTEFQFYTIRIASDPYAIIIHTGSTKHDLSCERKYMWDGF